MPRDDELKEKEQQEAEQPAETPEKAVVDAAQAAKEKSAIEVIAEVEKRKDYLRSYEEIDFVIPEETRYEPEEVWFPNSEDITGWTETTHELFLNDALRMKAYEQGIKEAVKPGMTVVDLGTGTGILAELALKAGADKVYGIEFNPQRIEEATQRMKDAELDDKFEIVEGLSYEVQLPERVDLIISEILGNLGDNEGMIAILNDAKERLLKPEGKFLPNKVEVFLTPVCSTKAHDQVQQRQFRGITDVGLLRKLLEQRGVTNQFDLTYDVLLPKETELDEPQMVQSFNFDGNDKEEYKVESQFTVTKEGVFTGFKGFFKAELSDDTVLDISGDDVDKRTASDNWKHAYLPVEKSFPVKPGDVIELTYERQEPKVKKVTDLNQHYAWSGRILRDNKVVHTFDQRMGRD